MLKSFISLKPASPISIKNNKFLSKKNKRKNILLEALQCIFTILDFLTLSEIFNAYQIYKKSKKGKQVQNKIITYLIITKRNYNQQQQQKFFQNFLSFSELEKKSKLIIKKQQISIQKYKKENSFWRQSIIQDVQRTHIVNKFNSPQNQLIKSKCLDRSCITVQNQQRSRINMIKNKSNSFSTNISNFKCNFLLFNNGNGQNNINKQILQKQTLHFKNYLRIVLNALSNRNKQIGYVQGLNFWIKNMYENRLSEDQAFTLACFILENMKAQLLFKEQMIKVRQLCYVFQIYLYNNLPQIYYLLKKNDISPIIYASNWFITLFSQQLPRHIINKIWNLFLIKGWKILIKFGIAVVCSFQNQLKRIHRDQIHSFIRSILEKIDYEKQKKIWTIMTSIKVSNKMIDYLSKQMRFLSHDTEIQLWRIFQQRKQIQKIQNNQQKRYSFSCQSNVFYSSFISGSSRKLTLVSNILQQQQNQGLCYSKIQKPKYSTEPANQKFQFLSFCKSVDHI